MKKYDKVDLWMHALMVALVAIPIGMMIGVSLTDDQSQALEDYRSETVMVEIVQLYHSEKEGCYIMLVNTSDNLRCWLKGSWGKVGDKFRVNKKALNGYIQEEEDAPKEETSP